MLSNLKFNFGSTGFNIIYLLIITLLFSPLSGILAQNKSTYEDKLNQAESKFRDHKFDESILLIKKCLEQVDITEKEQIRSYALLTKVYLEKNDRIKAKEMLNKVLDLNSSYEANPETDGQAFLDLFQEVKNERGSNTWLWILAGAAVIGGVVAIVLTSSK